MFGYRKKIKEKNLSFVWFKLFGMYIFTFIPFIYLTCLNFLVWKPLRGKFVNLSHIILKLVNQKFVLFNFHCSSYQFGQTIICGPMRNLFFLILSDFLFTLETKQWKSLSFPSVLFSLANPNDDGKIVSYHPDGVES